MAYKAGSVFVDAKLDDKKFRAGMKSLGGAVTKGALAIGAAFAAGMVVSIKKADEFQKAMSNVATVIDTSTISTQSLTFALLKMDPALGSTTELTNGLYQAFSAGAETAEEALQITADSAMFAKAALTDTKTAVDVLTTAQNAYGKDVMDTTMAADLFFTTIKEGKITGEQLASTIGQSIPLFASMGIGLEELTSGMAAMTKQGISASESTTQMNAMVNAFIKPSAEMSAALAQIGYESGATFIETEGLAGALEFLEETTKGNKDEMSKLVPNIRGFKGVMALTGEGGKIFNEVLAEMETSVGASAEAFDKQEKTFETFKNTMDRTMVIMGNIGKSFVDDIAGGATDATASFNEFLMTGAAAEMFGQVIGTIAAAFAGLKEFLMPVVETLRDELGDVFTTVSDTIQTLTGETDGASASFNILGVVSASLSLGISLVSSVIQSSIEIFGSWITALTETGKTIGLLFRLMSKDVTWEDVKDQFATTGEAFKTLGTNYVDAYVDMYQTGVEGIQGFGASAETIATNISSTVSSTYEKTKNNFTSTYNHIITGQKDADDKIEDEAEDHADNVVSIYTGYYGEIADARESAWSQMLAGDSALYDEMVSGAQDALGQIAGIYDASFSAITSAADMFRENEKAEQTADYENQLSILDSQLDSEMITKASYDEQKETLDLKHATAMNAIEEKQFKASKANRIASVWIDAASSIMGWWAAAPQLGIVAGPIVAGIMTGVTLGAATAQSVAIGAQNFIPAFAGGGTMRGNGLARVNEQGGEIQRLADGTTIIPHDISRDIAGSAGQVINVSFEGANISDTMDLNRIVDKVSRRLGKELRAAS